MKDVLVKVTIGKTEVDKQFFLGNSDFNDMLNKLTLLADKVDVENLVFIIGKFTVKVTSGNRTCVDTGDDAIWRIVTAMCSTAYMLEVEGDNNAQ